MITTGHRGDGVRADCRVVLRPGAGSVDVRSDDATADLATLREHVDRLRRCFDADDLDLEVDDAGAPLFVLAARIEAAFRGANRAPRRDVRIERAVARPERSRRDRRRRSRLYLPGDLPRFMLHAVRCAPDAVLFDLEDGVTPDRKESARLLVRNALGALDFGVAERMLRVNPGPAGREDLAAVVPEGIDLVVIPKVEDAAEVVEVATTLQALEAETGIGHPVWLMPIVESALGVERAFEIARASDRVVALAIGLEDYTADLGVVKTSTGEESLFARQRLVNAAKAAGLQAIDSVYGDARDTEGLAAWCARSRAMGFDGMGCVHPRQIEAIHRGFSPTADEVAHARRVIEAFERGRAAGQGVVSLDGGMVGPPVVERARQILREAADGA